MTTNRNQFQDTDSEELPIIERVVKISRVAKVVKGGRHLSFNALVVVGDMSGHVGVGMGKADAVPDAVRKGAATARRNIVNICLKGNSIPHEVIAKYVGSIVMLKPAGEGTGVIAGGAVRAVVELAGVKDILTKVRRSTNPVNVVKATFKGLQMLKDPAEEFEKRKQLTEYAKVRAQERADRAERNRQRQNRRPAPPPQQPAASAPPPSAPQASAPAPSAPPASESPASPPTPSAPQASAAERASGKYATAERASGKRVSGKPATAERASGKRVSGKSADASCRGLVYLGL